MRHIQQRFDKDCGVAVAAMLSNKSYEYVQGVSSSKYRTCGMSDNSFLRLLKKLTNKKWRAIILETPIDVEKFKPNKRFIALRIEKKWQRFGHLIATNGFYYYDPNEENPIPIKEAGKAFEGWKVTAVYKCR